MERLLQRADDRGRRAESEAQQPLAHQRAERVAGGPVGADAGEDHLAPLRAQAAEAPLDGQRQRGEGAGVLTPHLAQSRH